MKRVVLVSIIVLTLFAPIIVFAQGTTVFGDMSFGLGGSLYSAQYTGAYGMDSFGNPYFGTFPNLSGSSFDLVFGAHAYWKLGETFGQMLSGLGLWMGTGITLSIPVTYGSNNANGAIGPLVLSLDVPFLFDISQYLSIGAKASLLGVMLFDGLSADTLYGFGFSVGAGPVFYLDERQNYGISTMVGYRYISTSGSNYYWGNETYAGSSLYVTVCFTLELGSNGVVDDGSTDDEPN